MKIGKAAKWIFVFRLLITLLSLSLIVLHILKIITIDTFVIILFVVSIVPWIISSLNLKSIKIPGVGEFEFFEKQVKKAEKGIENKVQSQDQKSAIKGLSSISHGNEKSIPIMADEFGDNATKLILLKVQIETLLKKVFEMHASDTIKQKYLFLMPISRLIEALQTEGIIDFQDSRIILDILPILNLAVHGEAYKLNDDLMERTRNIGKSIIISLQSLTQ